MKNRISRLLVLLGLGGLCVALLGGCRKEIREEKDYSSVFEDIYSRLWKIENPQLNSVAVQCDTMSASFPRIQAVDEAFKSYSDSLSAVKTALSEALATVHAKAEALGAEFDRAASDAASSGRVTAEEEARKIKAVKEDVLSQIAATRVLTDNALSELTGAVEAAPQVELTLRSHLADAEEWAVKAASSSDWAAATVSTLDHADLLSADFAGISSCAEGLDALFSELRGELLGELRSDVAAAMLPVLSYFSSDGASEILSGYARAVSAASASLQKAYSASLSKNIANARESVGNWVNPSLGEFGAVVEADSLAAYSARRLAAMLSSQKTYLEAVGASTLLDAETAEALQDNSKAAEALSSSINETHSSLAVEAKSLQEVCRKAVKEAIASNGGCLRGEIAVGVVEANIAARDALSGAEEREKSTEKTVGGVQTEVSIIRKSLIQSDSDEVAKKIEDISRRIQSITFVPEYSDGKATVYYRVNSGVISPLISHAVFDIRPLGAAAELASVWKDALSLQGVYTFTRASAGDDFSLNITSVALDGSRLDISYQGSSIEECFFENEISASACLVVSHGSTEKSSAYFPLMPKSLNWIEIPDLVFRDWLVNNFDTDSDGYISDFEAEAVKNMDLSSLASSSHVHSLEGIEYFTSLETLNCSGHHISELDLGHNTLLTSVVAKDNDIESVNLTKCPALVTLDLSGNALGSIDLSGNPLLETLDLDGNSAIGELDISLNPKLKTLSAQNLGISRLDLRNNLSLTRFNVFEPTQRRIVIVVKSKDWLDSITPLSNYGVAYYADDKYFFYNGAIEVDGVVWKHYDSEATESNLYGDVYTFSKAGSLCPSGWKLPSHDNFSSLAQNASEWNTYNKVVGRYFSGSQPYSASTPAVFLNATAASSPYGAFWSNDYAGDRTLWCLRFSGNQILPDYKAYTFEFSNDRLGSRCVKQ